MEKVIVITGQTGVGKTDISLTLAKKFNGEIINCDASQIRRELDIGTAKIDLNKVDVKHHLIDIIGPNDPFSIKDYQELARNKISEIISKGKIPFLVGGSGLYINSVIGDYNLDIEGRNQEFEKQYENLSNEQLHYVLQELDFQTSQTIHQNNRRRVLRAIEAAKFGNKISENKTGTKFLYDSLILCLTCDRDLLYDRINRRVDIMMANGWLEEVKKLKSKGIDLNSIKDIGYKELNQYLENEISFDDAITTIKQNTRHYAKRQMTWFKNKMNCLFIEMDYQDPSKTMKIISEKVENFMKDKS